MNNTLDSINQVVWGVPTLVLILGVGVFLSVKNGFPQLTLFPEACRVFFRRFRGRGNASSYQSLCTALAATVGTGNLAGVAGALAIGGPGAIFWMWCSGFLGMATKYAEATLSIRYRRRDSAGNFHGGPMHMIRFGLGKRYHWLSYVYCFLGVVAAFGVGNATQVNTVICGINQAIASFGGGETESGNLLMGIGLAVLVSTLLLGGVKRIGNTAEKLVPFAAGVYIILGLLVLLIHVDRIPHAFVAIFQGAFSPKAITGGVVGSLLTSLRIGVSRGVFTNEAGMGTAAIAHSNAQVSHPVQQGLMGIIEVFLDTIVICTLTALVILCSGVQIPYGTDPGINLTGVAFSSTLGDWISVIIAVALCCFAFATILGWGMYGARCAQFLLGDAAWKPFAILQGIIVVFSAILQTETVWLLSEIFNGLMAIPNLLALVALSPELGRLTKEFRNQFDR